MATTSLLKHCIGEQPWLEASTTWPAKNDAAFPSQGKQACPSERSPDSIEKKRECEHVQVGPADRHPTRSVLARCEAYFASGIHSFFWGRMSMRPWRSRPASGGVDLAVASGETVHLFEFKVVEREPTGGALKRLRDRGYADKCRKPGRAINPIGIEQCRGIRSGQGVTALFPVLGATCGAETRPPATVNASQA